MTLFHTSSLRGNAEAIHRLPRVLCTLAMTMLLIFPVLAAEKNDQKPSEIIAPYPAKVKTEFLTACVGLHREMIPACRCMILTFEKTTSLKDFEAIAKSAEPAENATFKHVASACLRRIQTSQ